MRMPSRWILSKPTKVRTLSMASGVTLSVFFFSKPKPQRLMSGAAGHIIAPTRVARDDDGLQEDLAQHRVHELRLIAVDR